MKRTTIIPVVLLALGHLASTAHAIPASPYSFDVVQPDGTRITLRVRGDERFNWLEDLNGFTVVVDNRRYVYADLGPGRDLTPTNLVVGRDDPPGQAWGRYRGSCRRRAPVPCRLRAAGRGRGGHSGGLAGGERPQPGDPLPVQRPHAGGADPRSGRLRHPVQRRRGPCDPRADGECPRRLHRELVRLHDPEQHGRGVGHPPAHGGLLRERPEWAAGQDAIPNNAAGMVKDALDLVDATLDFGQFDADNDGFIDAIAVVHSGYDAATGGGLGNWIWSHRSRLTEAPGGQWTSARGPVCLTAHEPSSSLPFDEKGRLKSLFPNSTA